MTEETLEPVETETDPEERIRELTAENRRLRKRIKQMREAAATSKKVEFSKIIFCGVSIVTISITVFSCWIIYSTMDTSALAYLIPAVFAEMASATGFYYTKAKAENKIKLMNANGVQPEADNFNDLKVPRYIAEGLEWLLEQMKKKQVEILTTAPTTAVSGTTAAGTGSEDTP